MSLYLVQHGLSLPAEVDPERGLSDEGAAEVRTIASVARTYGVRVSAIVHSGKKRALQTAELLAAALDPPGGTSSAAGIGPLDDVAAALPSLTGKGGLMVVGHLPFLGKLASRLVTGSEKNEIFAFQNGGIVCLGERGEQGLWIVRWSLSPRIG